VNALGALARRLKACWFGPVVGWAVLALIAAIPTVHQCIGIAAVRGGRGGIFCGWSTALQTTSRTALVLVIAGTTIVLALQLVSSRPGFLVAVGIGSSAIWIAVVYLLATNIGLAFWLSSHGLEYYMAELSSEVALMLLSAILPLAAGLQAGRRSRPAPRPSSR
jgi:hypothetical protein